MSKQYEPQDEEDDEFRPKRRRAADSDNMIADARQAVAVNLARFRGMGAITDREDLLMLQSLVKMAIELRKEERQAAAEEEINEITAEQLLNIGPQLLKNLKQQKVGT